MSSNLYYELQYVPLISYRLERFRRTARNKWSFRCPICGDSKKSQRRARGSIYEFEGKLRYGCYNCGASLSFISFLKDLEPALYSQLLSDIYTDTRHESEEEDLEWLKTLSYSTIPKKTSPAISTKYATPIIRLKSKHAAVCYLKERHIPEDKWPYLYFTRTFEAFCGQPQYREEPRIVFPCLDRSKTMFFAQGRLLPDHQGIRYKGYRVFGDLPTAFGVDRVDPETRIFVTEGPIDSLFLPNSLAICSFRLYRIADILEQHGLKVSVSKITLVFDNERRNPDIVNAMTHAAEMGFKVCVWPDNIPEKDINDMVLGGRMDYLSIIEDNSLSGVEALLKIGLWRRCSPRTPIDMREDLTK